MTEIDKQLKADQTKIREVLNDKDQLIKCARNCFRRVDIDDSQYIQVEEMGELMRSMAKYV